MLWHWGKEQEEAVENIKELITKSPTLKHYDQTKEVVISADASQCGLGAALMQDGQPICYASRSLNSAEMNYAQIEKEILSIVFACEKFHQYIYGKHTVVENDHKPLQFIFNKPLNESPPRIQRFLLRLQRYSLTLQYVPGRNLTLADTLSRDPTTDQTETTNETEQEAERILHNIVADISMSSRTDTKIKEEINGSEQLQMLLKYIQDGWPNNRRDVPKEIRMFWDVRDSLTYMEGKILKGEQIFIPPKMRKEILQRIHEGHLGIDKCKRRARQNLYWPRMAQDIEEFVARCDMCLTHRNKQPKETLKPHDVPEYPWQKVASDIFTMEGRNYVLVVDYLSKFVEVALLNNMKSSELITHLKSIFSRHGIPEVMVTDNGPNYTSDEFQSFTKNWGIQHITSSPKYPQSNGLAERNVQTLKKLVKKSGKGHDPYLALLNFRTTPLKDSLSPAEILMGRKLRTTLPSTQTLFITPTTQIAQQAMRQKQKEQFSTYKGSRDLPSVK